MRSRVSRMVAIIASAALVTTGIGLPAAAQESSGEPAPTAEVEAVPGPPVADLQAAIDRLPDPPGNDDSGQMRSLLGLPDAFNLSFETQADGSVSRREQWFYYDLSTVFEFVDGSILWDLPLDAETSLLVDASRYDPAWFTADSTWESLVPHLADVDAFGSTPLDEGYGVPATVRAGDQLVLVFDDEGLLIYAETIPLSASAAP